MKNCSPSAVKNFEPLAEMGERAETKRDAASAVTATAVSNRMSQLVVLFQN